MGAPTEKVREVMAAGKRLWPKIEIAPARFARYVEERFPKGEGLDTTHAGDLWLACGCLEGDAAAVDAFESTLIHQVPMFVARIDKSEPFVDEVRQQLREKLLVAARGEAPKIAEYTGRGALGRWLHVVAIRVALNLKRRPKKTVDPDEADDKLLAAEPDPELDYIKKRYSKEFAQAFKDAMGKLTVKQRHILRLSIIDGLNLDRIAALEKVNRSTVARWLQAAREQLLRDTHKTLREKLKLDAVELESLLGLVRSRIDVSLHGMLKTMA